MAIRLDPDQRQTAVEDARHDIPNHADPLEYPDAGAIRRTFAAAPLPAAMAAMYQTAQAIESRETALPWDAIQPFRLKLLRDCDDD